MFPFIEYNSWGRCQRELNHSKRHDFGDRKNKRAENFHLPVRPHNRTGERKMQRFKSTESTQSFISVHSSIYNNFYLQRHLISRNTLRQFRIDAMRAWQSATAAA
jgi:putative transposase